MTEKLAQDDVAVLEQQFLDVLEFNQEFTPASPKVLKNSVVTTQGSSVEMLIEDLHVMPGFNVRIKDAEYHAHVRYLADDMKINGYRKNSPLSVISHLERGKPIVYITDGEHRFDAIKLANSEGAIIESAEVVFGAKSVTIEDLTVSLDRRPGRRLRPLERAAVCKRLVGFSWSLERIAKELSMTVVYVNQLLTLAGAPFAIRRMIEDGVLPAQVALDAMREHGGEAVSMLTVAAAKAKSQGAKKITKAGLAGRALPKKIVSGMVGSVDAFTSSLGDGVRAKLASLEKLAEEDLAGKKVEVDAAALMALLTSQKAADDFRAKQTAKAAKLTANADQEMAAAG